MAVRSYKTHGQATGLGDLYDKFVDFIINDAGWTLDTAVDVRDKVFLTTGVGGSRPPVYLRLTENAVPGGAQRFAQPVPSFSAYGYANYATNLFPFGLIGPEIYTHNLYGAAAINIGNGPGNVVGTDVVSPLFSATTWSGSSYTKTGSFSGDRSVFFTDGSNTRYSDLVTGDSFTVATGETVVANYQNVYVHTSDDNRYMYAFTGSTTATQRFRRINVDTQTLEYLADPPWTSATQTSAMLVFDGVDTIYAHRGQSSAEFAKYTISTNSWTSLASTPVVRPTSRATVPMIYVDAASSGLPEDRIYFLIDPSSANTWYYYTVDGATPNAWVQQAGVPITVTNISYGTAEYIGDGYIYAQLGSNAAAMKDMYVFDLAANAWSTQTLASDISVDNIFLNQNRRVFFEYPATLQAPGATLLDWWVSGDQDSLRLVSRETLTDGTEKYHVLYAGYYNNRYSSTRFDLANAITPGTAVTVNVSTDPSAEILPGAHWVLVDPDTGITESVQVLSVTSSSVTVKTISNSFGTNSYLTQDPLPFVVTNCFLAAAPFGVSGYRSSGIGDWFYIYAPNDAIVNSIFNTPGRQNIAMQEAIIFNNSAHNPSSDDILGSLKGVYFVPSGGGFPGVGAEVSINGGNILLIKPREFIPGLEDRMLGILLA